MGSDAPPVAIRPRSLGSRYIGAVGGNVRVRSLQSDRALARARYFRCLCYFGRKLNGPVTLAGGWFSVLRWQPTLAWGIGAGRGVRARQDIARRVFRISLFSILRVAHAPLSYPLSRHRRPACSRIGLRRSDRLHRNLSHGLVRSSFRILL